MEQSINCRFKELLRVLNMNKMQFSKLTGVSYTTVANLFNERQSKPSFDSLVMILKRIDNLNPMWLIFGEGDMFGEYKHSDIESVRNTRRDVAEYAEQLRVLRDQIKVKDRQIERLIGLVGKPKGDRMSLGYSA
ncbi:helix-turn-helix domain-containing protein [Fulvitalea axinellae]